MIILPTKNKETGEFYVSYSQLKKWKELKGFDTGRLGKEEYIRSYFLGEKFPSGHYADFGSQVEDYITARGSADMFSVEEKAVLEQIIPLGVYQKEIKIQFEGFYLKGFIDDTNGDFSHVRDYKTASEKSKAQYYTDEYQQLNIYALAIKKQYGKLPTNLEVCIISRTGNAFRGGRTVLAVGKDVWYVPKELKLEQLEALEQDIIKTVTEISEYYQVFLKLNK